MRMSATTTAPKRTKKGATSPPPTETYETRPLALALWTYAGGKLGYDFIPNGSPDFLVIRDALKEAKNDSLRALCDLALEYWQGVVRRYTSRLSVEDLSAVQSILCAGASEVESTEVAVGSDETMGAPEVAGGPTVELHPGDSIAVELLDQPFPHRLWLVATINPDSGVITTRSGDRLAPDDRALRIRKYGADGTEAAGARPMRWHAPPTTEHIAARNAEEPFFDAWVSLKSVMTELERAWTEDSPALFNAVVDALITLGLLADSEEAVTPEEWEQVKEQITSISSLLEGLDDEAFVRAVKISDKLRLAGLNIRSKRQSMAAAYPNRS